MKRHRSTPNEPTCKGLRKWLALNLGGPRALGALTGTDTRALAAAVHILELRAVTNEAGLLEAFRIVVLKMQPKTRFFAYHAIAFLGEWDDRAKVWARAGLPIEDLERVPRCRGDINAWSVVELDAMHEQEESAEQQRRERREGRHV